MWNKLPPIQIFLTPRFQKDLSQLTKRYRCIRKDITPLIEQLQTGAFPGDLVSGIKYQVFKVRLKNSNIQKGKSAGYRVIYYLKTNTNVILITIYSKSDQSDIPNKIIEDIIKQFQSEDKKL